MSEFLCKLSELGEVTPKVVRVANRRVVVVRVGDEVYALDPVCPHWAGPLDEGWVSVTRHEITCPWHRLRFSLRDGSCVASKGRPSATIFPVIVKKDDVFAEIPSRQPQSRGEPSVASTS